MQCDVALNFRTGFYPSLGGPVVVSPKLIAIHYLRTWLIIDVLMASA